MSFFLYQEIRLKAGFALSIFAFNNVPQQYAIRQAGGIRYRCFEQFMESEDEREKCNAAFQVPSFPTRDCLHVRVLFSIYTQESGASHGQNYKCSSVWARRISVARRMKLSVRFGPRRWWFWRGSLLTGIKCIWRRTRWRSWSVCSGLKTSQPSYSPVRLVLSKILRRNEARFVSKKVAENKNADWWKTRKLSAFCSA